MTSGRPSSESRRLLTQPVTSELTDDDDSANDEGLALWMAQDARAEMRRSSLASFRYHATASGVSSTAIPRNLTITSPSITLDTFTHKGIVLAEKVYVELQDRDFLRIVHIIQDTSTLAVTLRGWKFRRTREMNGVIDRKLNEVCWILHIDMNDSRDAKVQAMETVPVCEIVKRRSIRLTNQSFPALSWRDDGKKETPETVENDRVLVCRYKYLCLYDNAKARALYKWCEKVLVRLREVECDQRSDNNTKDEELRNIWRGHTVPGGAQKDWLPGEREFSRQEAVSHKGIFSRSSLKAPWGPDFPIGDPMKRGSVGSLLTEHDLQQTSDQVTQSTSLGSIDLVQRDDVLLSNDDSEEHPTKPILRLREQQCDRRKPHFNFAGFNGLSIDSDDFETDQGCDIFALRRGLRQRSIEPRKSRNQSPRIVEIDAQIKTSSSSGTFEKRYEGKITSRYYPTPVSARKKRPADISFGSPARPMKRVDRGSRVDSYKGHLRSTYNDQGSRTLPRNNRYFRLEPISSDSDRTLGRSQSPDSVEEICTPSKSRGYKTTASGLLTPVSRRKDSAPWRSRGTLLPSGTGRFPEYSQYCRTSSSVINHTQPHGISEDDNGTVDLTRPRASPYGSFSGAPPSVLQNSGPSKSLYAHSVLSSDACNTSPSRQSSRLTSVRPLFNSTSDLTPTETRQDCRSMTRESLAMTPRSSQVYKKLSLRSRKDAPSPSARRDKKYRRENLSTVIDAPASKANQRRYTFGDCFCGAGGMSRGAVSAGLRVSWGFDFNLAACQTYTMNFFRTPIYNVWANEFSEAKGDFKVDICHLSPPCQFFSDAHTVQGKDDEMNTASLFAIFNLLEKAKPRVVTLEQTSGLIRRHPIFFNAVINMFTSRGFSVRWKVMNCADFGVPQRRMRLFVMASW